MNLQEKHEFYRPEDFFDFCYLGETCSVRISKHNFKIQPIAKQKAQKIPTRLKLVEKKSFDTKKRKNDEIITLTVRPVYCLWLIWRYIYQHDTI